MSLDLLNEKMTNICDEVREILNTEDSLGLDAIANNLGIVNDDLANQTNLISQIASALEGKAAGGGGSSGGDDNTIEYYHIRLHISGTIPEDAILFFPDCYTDEEGTFYDEILFAPVSDLGEGTFEFDLPKNFFIGLSVSADFSPMLSGDYCTSYMVPLNLDGSLLGYFLRISEDTNYETLVVGIDF